MTSLTTRLQEGPGSRELSDEVLVALGWYQAALPAGGLSAKIWFDETGHADSLLPPDPTQSIDDALALVPDDDFITWALDSDRNSENEIVYSFELQDWHVPHDGMIDTISYAENAPTAALAICCALITEKERSRLVPNPAR